MKKTWFYTLSICFLILAQVVTAYAQEARAYATVLIIIPERPQQAAQVTPTAKEEKETAPEETSSQEEIALAKSEKEEPIKVTKEENTYILSEL